ncbi:EAL domain-containing protein [Caldifermentibacillus hisashii]|uniref:EAL domain-containing protein n=1 Tax=Caldifermentibacillus hisashii TaxID=996558 RepID=UPI0034D536FA
MDKSYVFNVLTDEKLAKLTNAIIIMGQLLHLDIVVEGVETKEHLAFINRFSNILAQGYYFSRPLPLEEFIESSINRN